MNTKSNTLLLEEAEDKLTALLIDVTDLLKVIINNAKQDGNINAHMVNAINTLLTSNKITIPELMERRRVLDHYRLAAISKEASLKEPDGYTKGYDPVFGLPVFADDDED